MDLPNRYKLLKFYDRATLRFVLDKMGVDERGL
jgi:hypothetical protein